MDRNLYITGYKKGSGSNETKWSNGNKRLLYAGYSTIADTFMTLSPPREII
jgi:hypothetical protein